MSDPQSVRDLFARTQEAFKLMKSQDPRGGRIINNGSISVHAPRPTRRPFIGRG